MRGPVYVCCVFQSGQDAAEPQLGHITLVPTEVDYLSFRILKMG